MGLPGAHVSCPNPTTSSVVSPHVSAGKNVSSRRLVASADAHSLPVVHPNRSATRRTCVSTTNPAESSPNATDATRCASFGPTPGSRLSSDAADGTFPANFAASWSAHALTYLALVRLKLQHETAASTSSTRGGAHRGLRDVAAERVAQSTRGDERDAVATLHAQKRRHEGLEMRVRGAAKTEEELVEDVYGCGAARSRVADAFERDAPTIRGGSGGRAGWPRGRKKRREASEAEVEVVAEAEAAARSRSTASP